MIEKPEGKGLFAWAIYDWANSSYFVIIQTFIFAAYFTKTIAENVEIGTAQWGNMISVAGIVIAIGAPVFGAIADQAGRRKPWIAAFTILCIIACGLLWFAEPGPDSLWLALGMGFMATIGAEFAFIFYSAMLPDLVSPEKLGRWSGWGWGMGYAGGLACLLVALFVFIQTDGFWLGLDTATSEPVRATFILTAIWYAIFSLPLFFITPDNPSTNKKIKDAIQHGFIQLKVSVKEVRKFKNIVKFLFARMFYNDAIVTIFAMGGVYAAGTFDMDEEQILMFGIGLNVTAGLGAFGFAWLDDKSGSKFTINASILGLLIPLVALIIVKSIAWFIIWGLVLGIFVGPIQAASRSFMARLSPPDLTNQMFGLLALSGKVTSFIGPFLVGFLTLQFGSQRLGMSAILVMLLIGLVLMFTVKEQEAPGIEVNPNQI
ncbi:MAG: MFS transporter [Balneola sp.]